MQSDYMSWRIEKMNNNRTVGIGFIGLLQIAFIVLKLCKVIEWSWWFVFAPIWSEIIILIILATIMVYIKRKRERNG